MTGELTLVPAERKHIGRISRLMRGVDALECQAMGREPKSALRMALTASNKAVTALVDGEPVAMFGVIVDNAVTGEGTPWFLGTDQVYERARDMLTIGPLMIAYMGDSMSRLSNLVCADNDRAIRLLKRWGFMVGEEQIEVRGVPFLAFSMDLN